MAPETDNTVTVPGWVPDRKYVAIVHGTVVAVGDSVAKIVAEALDKFRDEPIQVARKGEPIRPVHYAFHAESEPGCWK